MFKPLSLYLALRYVRSRHGNGFSSFISASSTIGIALGVMVLIVVLSAMNGFERALAQRLLSVVPHGEIISVNEPLADWQKSMVQVLKNPNVIAAAPVIKMTGMMQKGTQLKGVEIRGVDLQLEKQVSSIADYMIAGSWQGLAQEKSQENGIVIGSGIAKKLGLVVGEQVQILLPQPSQGQTSLKKQFPVPIRQQVNIVGIFKFGGVIDDSLAYISLKQAADIMQYHANQVQGIRIKVADVFQAPSIIREIAYNFDSYVYILDWTRTQGHLFNDIQLVRMIMYIVLVIVIAVASFNIVSTLIMAVNDKKGDIAILKTMGASSPMIMTTFMIQGLVNGVLGCIIGALSGVYLATNLTSIVSHIETFFDKKFLSADVYFIDFLPSYLNQSDVTITVVTALVMSLLATIYPAWQATKIEPAQVLGQM
ncbi:MAG: lipoprotein-releasing ABC transporter permease subunit LolE [Colwellia sp.]|nr:lipoprotein-releasing ABC transporter permease subunit LolE [Colwellia sp.]